MSKSLPWFASEMEVVALEQVVREQAGTALSLRLALAWQLRQREPRRAEAMVQALSNQALLPHEQARLCLLRAELAFLRDDFAQLEAELEAAQAGFVAIDNAAGLCDCCALRAVMAYELGRRDEMLATLHAMRQAAGDDLERRAVALAWLARAVAPSNIVQADQLAAQVDQLSLDSSPSARCQLDYYRAFACLMRGCFSESIAANVAAFRSAVECGNLYVAVKAACNLSYAFSNLRDLHSALEWAQLAQSKADQLTQSTCKAAALAVAADALRGLQRWDHACELLQEAQRLYQRGEASHAHAVVLTRQAELMLDMDQLDAAQQSYCTLQRHAQLSPNTELLDIASLGLAKVAFKRGHLGEARAQAEALLARDSAGPTRRIAALELLASIADAAAPDEAGVADSLALLERAFELARGVANYSVPSSLLDALAAAHAQRGNAQRALHLAREANQARQAAYTQASSQRALALQVQRETQRLQTEAEQQRRMLDDQARRSEWLQHANDTLERLGAIGRDIVARLDTQAICACLHAHAQALMPMDSFFVFRLQARERQLLCVFGHEVGAELVGLRIDLDNSASQTARCARERRQLLTETAMLLPGSRPMQSMMFTPLLANGQLLGVLTIQSERANAYGEQELAMLRSLAAFAAIGLANASSLEQLRRTQSQAAQRERLSSLGELVASLGREIRHPLTVISSSGQDMAGCLDELLARLPELVQRLDEQARAQLAALLEGLQALNAGLSGRDEPSQRRQLAQALQRAGIDDSAVARPLAEILLPLGGLAALDLLRPLLGHAERERVIELIGLLSRLFAHASRLGQAAARAARVIHALKTYARLELDHDKQPLSLRDSLETVLTLHQHQFSQGIELCCRFDELAPLQANAADMLRLWTLLLEGSLRGVLSPGRIEWSLRQVDGAAKLTVSTSAVAGSAELHPAVQRIITGHGGQLIVEPTITQGRRIAVHLPYNRERT